MYERILVPVDGSPTSDRGLREAIRLAKLTGAEVRLLHVVDVMSLMAVADGYVGTAGDVLGHARRTGEQIVDAARLVASGEGVTAQATVLENTAGRVADLVAEEATRWRADLIVVGTHGRRGVGRVVLGSDAEQIARLAPVPVLLVRGREG